MNTYNSPFYIFTKKKKIQLQYAANLTHLLDSEINCRAKSVESPGVRMSSLTSLAYNIVHEAHISKDMLRLPHHKKRLTMRWAYWHHRVLRYVSSTFRKTQWKQLHTSSSACRCCWNVYHTRSQKEHKKGFKNEDVKCSSTDIPSDYPSK